VREAWQDHTGGGAGPGSAKEGRRTLVMTSIPPSRLKMRSGWGFAKGEPIRRDGGWSGFLDAALLDAKPLPSDRLIRNYAPNAAAAKRSSEPLLPEDMAGNCRESWSTWPWSGCSRCRPSEGYDRIILDTPPHPPAMDFLQARSP